MSDDPKDDARDDPALVEAEGVLRAACVRGPLACAVVTGTGLGPLTGLLEDATSIAYGDIPGFPAPGVSGHGGRLHCGRVGGRAVLVFEGRAHAYEHGRADAMRVPLGTTARLGCPRVLLTNAAGSLLPEAGPGSLVAIADHINLAGLNPLTGEARDARFVPMTDAYAPALRRLLAEAAAECAIPLHAGTYAWFAGPSFETPAEVRMAGRLGADLVGMSTVPETILARFFGLDVAAISVVTNHAAGLAGGDPHHAETKAAAAAAAGDLARLVAAFIGRLPEPTP